MSTIAPSFSSRKRLSLAVRVSVLLVLAVVIPLIITVVGSEVILRPTLISQATTEMGNDAQSHAQNIDSLLINRQQDLGYLDQYVAIQQVLAGNQLYQKQASSELEVGYHLDPNYSNWSLFNTRGKPILGFPAAPTARGNYMIPPEIMDQLPTTNKALVSDVYFDRNTNIGFIDIYASIKSSTGTFLGIARSTLNLTDIWTALNNETNAAPGSYAMIVDENGVRIGYTNTDTTLTTVPTALFKTVAPLSAQLQQRIKNEDLYGNSQAPVTVLSDPTLANIQRNTQSSNTTQFTPALQNEAFQAYQIRCQVVPWTYIVLRPVSTITKAANQQDIYLYSLAAIITILAAIVGLIIGRRITRPILGSVSSLIKSSEMLKTLASNEQATATEQQWIVESSQVGLQSVQYYAEASGLAARRLDEIGRDFTRDLNQLDAVRTQHRLNEIISTANYLEKAASHQERSSKSLSAAIRVTTQITEQLVSGATSASEASKQLENVISQLRHVVGE